MDDLSRLQTMMEKDLEGIKSNLVRGHYREQHSYFEVLGEAKNLIKMISEVEKLIAKRIADDDIFLEDE